MEKETKKKLRNFMFTHNSINQNYNSKNKSNYFKFKKTKLTINLFQQVKIMHGY